jgi:hypothetical protein
MDHADDGGDDDVFIYMGGDQEVPRDVTRIRVHKSVKIITASAFRYCYYLVSMELHDGVEIIEQQAFYNCTVLRGIKLPGVRVIEMYAFANCTALVDVEFGDKLEIIRRNAFYYDCISLANIEIAKVRVIEFAAFNGCDQLTDAKLSKDIEEIGERSFSRCRRLRRIAMPLRANIIGGEYVFSNCINLSQIEIIGGIHKTISSLLLDSWRNEINNEIDRINQDLPNTPANEKTSLIGQWTRSVLQRIEHYKAEHYALVKEFTTLLELALWKAKIDESQDERSLGSGHQPAKKPKIDTKASRQEQRITSGANVVIKNMLPFLKLE